MVRQCGQKPGVVEPPAERGFTLIETLVALAVLGIIAVVLMSGMSMASRSIIIGSEITTAESLARSQVEYIQKQTYDPDNNPPVYDTISIPSDLSGYTFATPLAERLDPAGNGTNNDDGMQKITVTVLHNSEVVFRLEDYKLDR